MKIWKYSLIALFAAALTLGIVGCGGSKGDKTPPVLTLYAQAVGYVDEPYTVTMATAEDETDGKVSVAVAVSSPSGKGIGLSGDSFTPHESGTYKVTFTARDKAGNVAKKNDDIVVRYRNAGPVITVGSYAATVKEGEVYTLPQVRAEDAEGELPVTTTVVDPHNGRIEIKTGNSFLVEYPGLYYLRFTAVNSDNISAEKVVSFTASPADKVVDGLDGVIDSFYDGAIQTYVGGFRGLEKIGVKIMRGETGAYFAFDASSDTRVSSGERLEVYLDGKGTSYSPTENSLRLDLSPDGTLRLMKGPNWAAETRLDAVEWSKRPVAAVKLGEGTTLAAGNTDDSGYTAELFVPYALIGISSNESFYLTLGCIREGDSGWDGWNEAAIFSDPQHPHIYAEVTANGILRNTDRNYMDSTKADGAIGDARYTANGSVTTTVGGARNLEGATVRIARDSEGLWFAIDSASDRRVNDYDRVEVYFYIGEPSAAPARNRSFGFFAHSNGGLIVTNWNNGWAAQYYASTARPAYAAAYYPGTTPNSNDDTDAGWHGELFIPYAFFNTNSAGRVDENTDFRLTFGIWRASAAFNASTDDTWSTDPAKDWDGWGQPDFSDPLLPQHYSYLTWDGQMVSNVEGLSNRLPPPTDPDVDGVLDEAYWQQGATLELPKGADYDGVSATFYRDTKGLRVGFRGDVYKITDRDVIVLYLSTKDSTYEIGGQLGDAYSVNGQYASIYDWMFQIHLNRAAAVFRGLHKDWTDKIDDLSALSFAMGPETENGYTAELYIPYDFLKASDGYKPTKDTTLGVSLRLVGENSRGSAVWNNLHYAGIYCDSESPASYVRLDKDNKMFAATKNDASYRVDGAFDEELYKGTHATLASGNSTAELWRSAEGVHVKVTFGAQEAFRLVLSTLDHGLGAPYVYDRLIVVKSDGTVEGSAGNSHTFADPSLYVSYSAPRAIVKGGVAELFIPYEWLSRYNVTDTYTDKGYMEITEGSELRLAGEWLTGTQSASCTYNGAAGNFDLADPETYRQFTVQGA